MSSSVRGAENNAIFWAKEQDQQKTNGAPTPVWIGCIRTLPSPQLFPRPEPQPPQESVITFPCLVLLPAQPAIHRRGSRRSRDSVRLFNVKVPQPMQCVAPT